MPRLVRDEPSVEQIDAAARTLKLLADTTRLQIFWALLHGEHSVNELAEHVGAQPSAVSQHLAKLRLGQLVRTRREGTRMFYAAADDHLETIVAELIRHTEHAYAAAPTVEQRRSGGA